MCFTRHTVRTAGFDAAVSRRAFDERALEAISDTSNGHFVEHELVMMLADLQRKCAS
jgi:hypothetical protein